MKIFISIYLVFATLACSAQQKTPAKYFRIVAKGFCTGEPSAKCERNQRIYLVACEKIGDDFYAAKHYDSAIKCYELPVEMNDHIVDLNGTLFDKRNMIIGKAANMYLKGTGTGQDIQHAYWLHRQFPMTQTRAKQLSLIYLNTTDDFREPGLYTGGKKTYREIEVNPFMISDTSLYQHIAGTIISFHQSEKNIGIVLRQEQPVSEMVTSLGFRMVSEVVKRIKQQLPGVNVFQDDDGEFTSPDSKGISRPVIQFFFE